MEGERRATHFPDWLRVGVLGEGEEAKLRFVPHLMDCQRCREHMLAVADGIVAFLRASSPLACHQARNAVFQYLEFDRPLGDEVLAHLTSCPDCYEHFIEPANNLAVIEADETGLPG